MHFLVVGGGLIPSKSFLLQGSNLSLLIGHKGVQLLPIEEQGFAVDREHGNILVGLEKFGAQVLHVLP